jgi:hypothetical protein
MKNSFYIFISILVLSCNLEDDKPKPVVIEDRPAFSSKQDNEVFRRLSSQPQTITANFKADTSVTLAGGTTISIPTGCFVDSTGKTITDGVTIKVIEAVSLADFLRNDLQTVSNGQPLQSAGMIHIDATANGKPLAIKEGLALGIELPTNFMGNGFSMFAGAYDADGNINWQEEGPMDQTMLPIPLELLDLKYYTSFRHSKMSFIEFMDSVTLSGSKYADTYLATMEFKERFQLLMPSSLALWAQEDMLPEDVDDTTTVYKIQCEPLQIYLNNTDKPLWHVDSLVYVYLNAKSLKDSVKHRNSERYTEGDFDRPWNFGKLFRSFFPNEGLTQPVKIDLKGVDPNTANAKELLMEKGYDESMASQILMNHQRRERIIYELRRKKDAQDELAAFGAEKRKAYSNAFKVTKLGWVNVDKFYDDPIAQQVHLAVNVLGDSLSFYDVTLLLPRLSIALNGIANGNGSYRFTQSVEGYNKLPLGETAVVIALSSKGDQPYLATQMIKIEERQNVELTLTASTWEDVKTSLSKFD